MESINKNYNSNDKTIIIVGNLKYKQLISDSKLLEYSNMHNFSYVKYCKNDNLFYDKIFQLIINNKKNGKQKNRSLCIDKLVSCISISH